MSVQTNSNSLISWPPVRTAQFAEGLGVDAISKSQNRNDTRPSESEETGALEEDIEVSSEQPLVIAEKYAVLRVTRVCSYIQRTEVIGHIEDAKAKAQRIFLVDFHIFGNTGVGGEKLGIPKSVAIRHSDIIAGCVDGCVGEPSVVFHDRVDLHPRQQKKPHARKRSGGSPGSAVN